MIDEQPISYTKKPIPGEIQPNGMVTPLSSGTTGSTTTSSSTASSTQPPQKKNDRRKLLAVLGLVVFLVVAGMGVYIALRQRLDDSQLAPNAPESQPSADVTQTATCTLSFDVPGDATPTPGVTPTPSPTPTPIACAAASFDEQFNAGTALAQFTTSGSGTATVSASRANLTVPVASGTGFDPRYAMEIEEPITGVFESGVVVSTLVAPNDNQGLINLNADSDEKDTTPNREVVIMSVRKTTGTGRKVVFQTLKGGAYSTAVEQVISGTGPVTLKLERTASNTFIGSYDLGNGMVKLSEATGFSKPMYMRVALRSDGSNTAVAPAQVTSQIDRFWVACPTTTGGPTYACNSICTTDANCQTVNTSYVCATVDNEKRCRLNSNTSSESCETVVTTTPTPTPEVTPTPTIGCNNTCINNSDCANPDHICYNNRCRLATAPESSSCTVTTVVPTPTPTIGCGNVCSDNSDCSNSAHICYNNICRLGENPTNQYCAPESAMNPPVGGVQPELPAELPQTGPEDWANWLKVGLGVVVVGAVLMLFL